MSILQAMMGNLNTLSIFDIFFPWLLFFTIIYAILSKTEALGKEISVQGTVSFVAAFFIVNYVLPPFFLTRLFGIMGTFVAGFLVLIVLLGMAGFKLEEMLGKDNKTLLAIGIGVIAIIVFITVGGLDAFGFISEEALIVLAFLAMMFAAVFMLGKGGGG